MEVTLFLILFIFNKIQHNSANIENIDLNYTNAKPTYDELFNDGLNAYNQGDHQTAVLYLEKAVSDYRFEGEVRGQCWLKCESKLKKIQTEYNGLFDGQLNYLHYSIKMKSCCELCKEQFLGRRGAVARYVRELFEEREPYQYLQYSYYKIGEVEKSLNAAYTYFEVHKNSTMMKKNIDILLKKLKKKETSIQSMEELMHSKLYKQGETAYNKGEFHTCINKFEESLLYFYKEVEKCHAICEQEHERSQVSYSVSLFGHYKAIIDCRQRCRKKLTSIDSYTSSSHFVPYYFHYLQYCYFEAGKVLEAATCAVTYSLFIPDDAVMSANIGFYKKQSTVIGKKIEPRIQASKYFKQFALEVSLYAIVKGYANPMFAASADELLQKTKKEDEDMDFIFDSVFQELTPQEVKGDPDTAATVNLKPLQYRNQNRWKHNRDINDSLLFMEEKALNGTNRVAFDNVATVDECKQLMHLVQNLATFGDGYQHNHDDAAHPFTKKEMFKGVTVHDAVEAVTSGQANLKNVEYYVNISDRVRLLTQEYFDLPIRLNLAFTHLVCRHALSDAINEGEEHISHPLHSDNCVIDGDGVGTCPKREPAYTWRDFSALMYLNDDFVGGDFIFANYKREIQTRVRPKCGRMVAFQSNGVENLHGVLGVNKGTRCALALWFTLKQNKQEDGRNAAVRKLVDLKKTMILNNSHQLKNEL